MKNPNLIPTEPFRLVCKGGLDLRQDVAAADPGKAVELINYEPSIEGGYRRIDGTYRITTSECLTLDANPPAKNRILGLGHSFNDPFGLVSVRVYAAIKLTAGYQVQYITFIPNDSAFAGRTYNWQIAYTDVVPSLDPNAKFHFHPFTYANLSYTLVTGEVATGFASPARLIDGTTNPLVITTLNGAGAPSAPSYGCFFRSRIVLAQQSSIYLTAPNTLSDFSAANGAIQIDTGLHITGIYPFRDALIIFSTRGIKKLVGDSSATFSLEPVTVETNCVGQATISEIAGDLLFYTTEGIRSYAATERLGDVELSTVSRPINSIISNPFTYHRQINIGFLYNALPIRSKNQYRLFQYTSKDANTFSGFNPTNYNAIQTATFKAGVLGALTQGYIDSTTSQPVWEWAELDGFNAAHSTNFNINGQEWVLFVTPNNNHVYRMDYGDTFNKSFFTGQTSTGDAIFCNYRTVDLDLGSPTLRKTAFKIIPEIKREVPPATLMMDVIYDYGDSWVTEPASYTLSADSADATWASSGGITWGAFNWNAGVASARRQPVEGSGFRLALQFSTSVTNTHIMKAITIEYAPEGPR